MKTPWTRLIRFEATDGRILRGEPILPNDDFDLGSYEHHSNSQQLQAKVISGDDIYENCTVTDEVVDVARILSPLSQSDVPILRCVGLNYAKHIKEAGRQPPPFPFIFFKPNTTVLDHGANIVVPKIAQDDQADYEGELVCSVISHQDSPH